MFHLKSHRKRKLSKMRRGINQSQLEEEQKPSEKINYTEKHFTRQRIQRIRIKDANKLGRWIDE